MQKLLRTGSPLNYSGSHRGFRTLRRERSFVGNERENIFFVQKQANIRPQDIKCMINWTAGHKGRGSFFSPQICVLLDLITFLNHYQYCFMTKIHIEDRKSQCTYQKASFKQEQQEIHCVDRGHALALHFQRKAVCL